jgi:hypothetical protein
MMIRLYTCLILVLFSFSNVLSQVRSDNITVVNYNSFEDNPLAPAKAAFYSAVLPGLGQAYNKKYWKIPVIYAALGASVYFYKRNDDQHNDILRAYKNRLAGRPDEFSNLDISALERGIRDFKKDRDLSLFVGIGLYILNVLEANIDAHLPDKKIDTNLSFKPNIYYNQYTNNVNYGIGVTFRF